MLAGDIRKGSTFEYKSGVYTVTDFQHVKPGKGAAFVRTTLKNVVTGQVLSDQTFNPTAKLETVQVETKKMTYSYFDGEFYVFMDDEYNQTMLTHDQVEDALKYIKENDVVTVKFLYGNAFSVEPENFVELKVIEAEPGVKGNTATNVMKNAKVETGAIIQVPMFVNEGETIRIDTRTGEYMSRV
ncbi:MAG TPA: elongation factor P [Candidatus Scatosoma pullistercoris]|uniref:Elongation factor P n=1 Tax=Candidatus Scatosoma pullistercoris TaxID=2840934 RepID=A0A9D1MFM5_9FIRM|nr:elongation factor P [Candidatus Scatosoma pullicola]HIU59202.1 elongation factor P [Candidatus Scatosoma pullistercoris]